MPHLTKTRLALGTLLVLLASIGAQSRADTRSELDTAAHRLRALEDKIQSKEADLAKFQRRLQDQATQVDRRRADAAQVQRQLKATRAELDETAGEYQRLRVRLGARARTVYVHGPTTVFALVLDARSFGELSSRITYAGRLIRQDADLSLRMRRTAAKLEVQKADQQRLLSERADAYRRATSEQRALEATFAQHQKTHTELVQARAEVGRLVEQLRGKLRAEELARAIRVAGHGMPITFGAWAGHFLDALGAPKSRDNLVVVVAWETAEYTMATWNPLATTYGMPGATTFNSHGVKNYQSLEEGVEASILTLSRPGHGYEAIVSNLKAGSEALVTADAIRASDWCRGCAGGGYVVSLVPAVQAYYERYAGS